MSDTEQARGDRLKFSVWVTSENGRTMSLKDWDRIAKRLERAAKGRSQSRSVSVGPGR